MNKKLIFSSILLFFLLVNLNSQEFKFPGTFDFEFICRPVVMDSSNGLKYTDSYEKDFKVDEIKLENEIKGGLTFTIREIYTVSPWVKDIFRVNDAPWIGNDLIIGLENKLAVLRGNNWMDVGLNIEYKTVWNTNEHINLEIKPILYWQGKIGVAGFYWKIEETCPIALNPEFYRDKDPTQKNTFFDKITSETWIGLEFEFFHFFAPEIIKGTLYAENKLSVVIPYSYYTEKQKEILNETKIGFNFDFAGVKPFFYFWMRTYNYYHSTEPVDGTSGSSVTWTSSDQWSGDSVHSNNSVRVGTRVGIKYEKDYMSFGIEYFGDIESQPYLYNLGGDYSAWKNKVEVWVQVKLGNTTKTLSGWE